jgi:hypothetical protein
MRYFHIRLLFSLLFFSTLQSFAQETYLPLDPEKYHLLDRMDILSGKKSENSHSVMKPYYRPAVKEMTDSALLNYKRVSKVDSSQIAFYENDEWELYDEEKGDSRKPFLKYIYRKKASLAHHRSEHLKIILNPVLNLSYGKQFTGKNEAVYLNTRGFEIKGSIDQKVGFYMMATDNQALFQDFAQERVTQNGYPLPVVPGEGFAKYYKNGKAVDFISARGYITFAATKHIQLQVGHDKNFIGNGYRSLFLSDYAAPYSFVKINAKIWKLNYQVMYAEMNAGYVNGEPYNKKIFTTHHLNIAIRKNLTFGLFESSLTGPRDSTQKDASWNLSTLNPVIFTRYIESYQGSYGNAFVGFDMKWNFARHFSFYGQLLFDELVFQEVKKRSGWWGNKQAFQVGLKYIDALGIKNFDLQSEFNYVRPYTYAHANNYTSYTHYNQALAHPMGANFWEWIGIARLQPAKKVFLTGKLFYIRTGEDSSYTTNNVNNNQGSNIFKSYDPIAKANTYNNSTGQGIATNIMMVSLQVAYMIKHNLYLDLYVQLRTKESAIATRNLDTQYLGGGIRWNIASRLQEY